MLFNLHYKFKKLLKFLLIATIHTYPMCFIQNYFRINQLFCNLIVQETLFSISYILCIQIQNSTSLYTSDVHNETSKHLKRVNLLEWCLNKSKAIRFDHGKRLIERKAISTSPLCRELISKEFHCCHRSRLLLLFCGMPGRIWNFYQCLLRFDFPDWSQVD